MSGSTSYGITDAGFVRFRFPEIYEQTIAEMASALQMQLDSGPDSVFGIVFGVIAEQLAIAWERMEEVYLAMYPSTAFGVSLDNAVAFSGVTRLQALRGSVIATMRGDSGTLVNAGFEARIADDRVNAFYLFSNTTLSRDRASWARYSVTGNSASVRINGITYATAPSLASPAAAAAALAGAVNAANAGLTASASGAQIDIADSADVGRYFDNESNLSLLKVGSPGEFRSVNFATFNIPAGAFTQITNPLAGLDSLSNAKAGTPGRQRETDDELRTRYVGGVYRLGASTVPSLRANLEAVEGVTRVRIYENTGDTTDGDGRPSHSVEAVVTGGAALDVAQTLFANKPAGIPTYGTTTQAITDEYGIAQSVKFTRPAPVYVWLTITLTGAAEETLPADYVSRVKTAVLAEAAKMQPGDNVYLHRMASAVSGIPGISKAVATAGTGTISTPPGSYGTADVAIGPRDQATIIESHIIVTGP